MKKRKWRKGCSQVSHTEYSSTSLRKVARKKLYKNSLTSRVSSGGRALDPTNINGVEGEGASQNVMLIVVVFFGGVVCFRFDILQRATSDRCACLASCVSTESSCDLLVLTEGGFSNMSTGKELLKKKHRDQISET